jgi:hypothetical protein
VYDEIHREVMILVNSNYHLELAFLPKYYPTSAIVAIFVKKYEFTVNFGTINLMLGRSVECSNSEVMFMERTFKDLKKS